MGITTTSSIEDTSPLASKSRYHWFCCECKDEAFQLEYRPETNDIYDIDGTTDTCACHHIRCHKCKIEKDNGIECEGTVSRNLLDKLKAEFLRGNDDKIYTWECCDCGEGPFVLPDPHSAKETEAWEDVCTGHGCRHWRCDHCPTYNTEKNHTDWRIVGKSEKLVYRNVTSIVESSSKPIAASGIIWVMDQDSSTRIDPLGTFEQKLQVFEDMGVDPMKIFQLHPSEIAMNALLEMRDGSPFSEASAGIDASTISSVSSPEAENGNSPELAARIKEKKEVVLKDVKQIRQRILDQTDQKSESRATDTIDFLLYWEHAIIPFLVEFLPIWYGPGYTIALRRGREPATRIIDIMTEFKPSEKQQSIIQHEVRSILPSQLQTNTIFSFRSGTICRANVNLDDICDPKNPYYYLSPTMGDSVGVAIGHGDDHSTSTLGPCVVIGETPYWLINFHPIEKALRSQDHGGIVLTMEHPSPDDRTTCASAGHNFMTNSKLDFSLGEVVSTSGMDSKTIRLSNNSYWDMVGLPPQKIVVDWALCSSKGEYVNITRTPAGLGDGHNEPIISFGEVPGGKSVHSTGRTSGFNHGQVCLGPMVVDGRMNETGTITREWYIEEPYPYDNEDGWTKSGIGISGDSGAGVVDDDTNVLYGQLWGRNECEKDTPGPRYTFFTPISDVFDDIQERYSGDERPRLPQCAQQISQPPARPVCNDCLVHHQNTYPSLTQETTDIAEIEKAYRDTNNIGNSTPMEELMASQEMTPMDDALVTPMTSSSPDCHRERTLLLHHTGYACGSPWADTPRVYGGSDVITPEILETNTPYTEFVDFDDLLDSVSDRSRKRRVSSDVEDRLAGFKRTKTK